MAFHPITAFKNPVTRPRAIIWAGTILVALLLFVTVMVGATTTYWFCAEICHAVQDDSIFSYNNSTHSKVSCVSCHMPAGANPVSYLIHKVEALKELPMTIMGTYEIPLNGHSHVSQSAYMMPDIQCTQCHNLANREVTPSAGIIIDHDVHTEAGVRCTLCHNRIAHREEGIELINKDPKTGELNVGHVNFMEMTACYRCHGLEQGSPAPGTCSSCHPADFKLKPKSHDVASFLKGKHGKMFTEQEDQVKETLEEYHLDAAPTPEVKTEQVEALLHEEGGHGDEGYPLAPVKAINECYTCHEQKFCNDCHGMPVPHTAEFVTPKSAGDAAGHPVAAKDKKLAAKCVMCHGADDKTAFCSDCHHGASMGWKYDAKSDWTSKQHPSAVADKGVAACTEKCHTIKFCNDCHADMKAVPSSHKARTFVKPKSPAMTVFGKTPAAPKADHALAAMKSTESCSVCHGQGGVNAKFCKSCHGMEMPHNDNFKKFHSKSSPSKCATCHGFKEVCSSCHHVGATANTSSWVKSHGGSVNKNGSESCVGKCHKQTDCVKCHQSRKIEPASHKKGDFVKGGTHAKLFAKDATNCLFCHTGKADTLANSTFCKGCHKLTMPHPEDGGEEKFAHSKAFADKKLKKATCQNCHSQRFCDKCHHKQSVAGKQWMYYHPGVVHKEGAEGCFQCHKETECSQCHVSLSKRGLIRR